ncbi:MAG: flagellar hook protein FlgE [Alphaproteobacteria bacterium]|nr:flagellar hook protein FlgE [Alphaproteobacteria bacterium]
MSLFGAMLSGVSALNGQTQALGAISDNISNVNTVGYRGTTTRFQSLVTASTTATRYTPGGVLSAPLALVDKQGLIQSSASPTDLALQGKGFMVVTNAASPASTDERFFTRAGSFRPDAQGRLVNASGFFLQGWPINVTTGALPSDLSSFTQMQTVNINTINATSQATSSVAIQANLQSSTATNSSAATYVVGNIATGAVTADFKRGMQIYDSLGQSHTLTLGAIKSATANTWNYEIFVEPGTDLLAASHATGNATGRVVASGNLVFNSDGTIDTSTTDDAAITTMNDRTSTALTVNATTGIFSGLTLVWGTSVGASNSTIGFNVGANATTSGLTQFDGASQLFGTTIDGTLYGTISGVTVASTGIVTARFDNGLTKNIYKIPIATFPNPSGLEGTSGNVYSSTANSGSVTIKQAGTGGAAEVAVSALEASTTDLAEEFSQMIVTQRAYTASTKIITTADEMLDELVRIKR